MRWNGPWLTYRLPKPTHTGKKFIQLDPIEFLDKIAAFIPPPRRHRHHYHGVFAPNAPLRPVVATAAIQTPKILVPPELQHTANEVTKVSLNWAKLIARIYEVNPLLCTLRQGDEDHNHCYRSNPKYGAFLRALVGQQKRPILILPLIFLIEICQLVVRNI